MWLRTDNNGGQGKKDFGTKPTLDSKAGKEDLAS